MDYQWFLKKKNLGMNINCMFNFCAWYRTQEYIPVVMTLYHIAAAWHVQTIHLSFI